MTSMLGPIEEGDMKVVDITMQTFMRPSNGTMSRPIHALTAEFDAYFTMMVVMVLLTMALLTLYVSCFVWVFRVTFTSIFQLTLFRETLTFQSGSLSLLRDVS